MIDSAAPVGPVGTNRIQKHLGGCEAAQAKQKATFKEFEAMLATQFVSQMLKEQPIGGGESQTRTGFVNTVIADVIGRSLADQSAFGVARMLEKSMGHACGTETPVPTRPEPEL